MKHFLLAPLAAALVLAGCATALPELPAQPQSPLQFKSSNERWTIATPAAAQADGAWWKSFADPVLDGLVDRAATGNTDIQQAVARLAQARALVRNAHADRLPQVGLGATALRQAGADTPGGIVPETLGWGGVRLSWEADLFGRLARAHDAATLDAQAREALLRSTRLLVQAETAQVYLGVRALDAERALVRETVAAYAGTLRLIQRRHQAGDVAELDVVRVQAELAATESEALALDRQRAAMENALATLVGEPASQFSLAPGGWETALPAIPAGIPATVLARRPDVAAAQASLLAAQARVGVAQAAWFPDVSLTAAGGKAGSEVSGNIKRSAPAGGGGALLSLPLFDGGRREAGVQGAQAQLDAAAASYRGQVLQALREVEDQLSALGLLQQQAQAQGRAVDAASRATTLSDTRYRNGLVSQLELLDARRSELRNRRQALQVRSAQFQATASLVRALGGGWDGPAAVGDQPPPATRLAATR